VLYECRVIQGFRLKRKVTYQGYDFLTLEIGRSLCIIEELGHPSEHPSLPDLGATEIDCLLLAVDEGDEKGWALASFLIPVA